MAALPSKEKKNSRVAEPDIEIEPDAWERFERAVDIVAKSPPQHRTKESGSKKKPRADRSGGAKGAK